jgi:hypothetical protein
MYGKVWSSQSNDEYPNRLSLYITFWPSFTTDYCLSDLERLNRVSMIHQKIIREGRSQLAKPAALNRSPQNDLHLRKNREACQKARPGHIVVQTRRLADLQWLLVGRPRPAQHNLPSRNSRARAPLKPQPKHVHQSTMVRATRRELHDPEG